MIVWLFISCHPPMPGAFWVNDDQPQIFKTMNDQGPWGGILSIDWHRHDGLAFNPDAVVAFARKNGWTLMRSVHINPKSTAIIADAEKYFAGLSKMKVSEGELYVFTSRMMAVEPGTTKERPAYGYLIIDKNKAAMFLRYVWGE